MTIKFKKQIQNQSQTGYVQNNQPQIAGREAGKQNRIKIQSQSGRSMIEMLGVLAIIAILSIGGIVGFRLAMNYYQANQIAHEMNMMRTDAQIKIAQGAEELMLGDPYDSGNIQFNGYKTDFDCLYLETETSAPDDVASCAVANAYYIELQEIPEGVCKPLANLIDKMDNEIAFYINDKSVDATEEKGTCGEGNNTLKVIFGADSDSNAVKCDTDAECESLESTPVCDETRHVCVECTEDDDCPYNTDYCEDNVCKTCDSGVWNGEECVECKTDEDCFEKDTENPVCNITEGKCEPCPEGESWKESAQGCAAYECRTNEDCNPEGGFENYCYFNGRRENKHNSEEWQNEDPQGAFYGGECHQVSADLTKKAIIRNIPFYGSEPRMTWWSACRICAAFNEESDSNCRAPTEFEPDFMATWTDIDWQCYSDDEDYPVPNPLQKKQGECRKHEGPIGNGNYPDVLREFDTMFGNSGYYFWFNNSWDNRIVYTMEFRGGNVSQDRRDNSWFSNGNALCKKIHKN